MGLVKMLLSTLGLKFILLDEIVFPIKLPSVIGGFNFLCHFCCRFISTLLILLTVANVEWDFTVLFDHFFPCQGWQLLHSTWVVASDPIKNVMSSISFYWFSCWFPHDQKMLSLLLSLLKLLLLLWFLWL